jgi:hypothetical protein
MAGGYRPRWGCSRSSRRIAAHLGGRGVVADGLNASTTAWRPSARNCTTTRERWPAPFPTPILQLVARYVPVVRGVMLLRADSYRQSSQASRRDRTGWPSTPHSRHCGCRGGWSRAKVLSEARRRIAELEGGEPVVVRLSRELRPPRYPRRRCLIRWATHEMASRSGPVGGDHGGVQS